MKVSTYDDKKDRDQSWEATISGLPDDLHFLEGMQEYGDTKENAVRNLRKKLRCLAHKFWVIVESDPPWYPNE